MSVISGTLGAVMGSQSQTDAARSSAGAQAQMGMASLLEQQRQFDKQQELFRPYAELGARTVPKLEGYDLMQGVGDQPNWDKEYTDRLSLYKESPAYQAQNQLGQLALKRQLAARGLNYGATGASAGAELNQRLIASDYDKYRSELADRYKALQGEYATRRDVNQNQYNQLLNAVKIGQGAAGSTAAASQNFGNQAGGIFQGLGTGIGQANAAAGQAGANMWSGLGGMTSGAINTGLKGYQMGKEMGWWGGGGGGAAAAGGGGGAANIMDSAGWGEASIF